MARLVAGVLLASLIVLGEGTVFCQNYPNKAIRIVTGGVGGGADFDARQIAPAISVLLGQPVIVDNRVALISAEIVSKAPHDGYTLLLAGSTFYIAPLLQQQLYDPLKDFSPITVMTRSIDVLVVNSSSQVTSIKELIALARARPGELNYASGSTAGPPSLSAALFKSMAGINIVRIPYKAGGPALNGLLSGEVQLMFSATASAMPHVKSGKLRALGITSAQPSTLVPGILPIAASLPGYESVSMTAIYAPAGTPGAIISRLNQEVVRLLNATETKETFLKIGEETVGNSPEEHAAMMKSELVKWGKVIKDANIKPD